MNSSSYEKRQAYYCSREWSLIKEAVRKRSHGICERCHANPADAVHHKTYARLYNERLDDLIHLCEGCHMFIHGKSNFDPAAKPPIKVYVAGPVVETKVPVVETKDDGNNYLYEGICNWRESFFTPEKHMTFSPGFKSDTNARFIYNGPTIQNSNHGFCDFDKHGLGLIYQNELSALNDNVSLTRINLVRRCTYELGESDFIFAWIDREETVGTVAEIGFAFARRKDIFIAFKNDYFLEHFYFIAAMADKTIVTDDALVGWEAFTQWVLSREFSNRDLSDFELSKIREQYNEPA